MKKSLVAGIQRVEHATADESNTIDFLGEELRVYSTPSMVHDVEYACWRLIGEHLDPGADVARCPRRDGPSRCDPARPPRGDCGDGRNPSRPGGQVTLEAEVRDAAEVVGRGTHVRVVTQVERLRPQGGVETRYGSRHATGRRS